MTRTQTHEKRRPERSRALFRMLKKHTEGKRLEGRQREIIGYGAGQAGRGDDRPPKLGSRERLDTPGRGQTTGGTPSSTEMSEENDLAS